MLSFLDLILTILHLIIITLNLFAWIPKPTRRLHLWIAGLTAFCWIGLGLWFGMGYCPITDWQWNVKAQLGETNLPSSFIKYFADKLFHADVNPSLIDILTVGCFAVAIGLSLFVNFRKQKAKS